MGGWTHGAGYGQLTRTDLTPDLNLMAPAWRVLNLLELRNRVMRGSSRQLPGQPGKRSRKRIRDEAVFHVEMKVRSDVNPTGAAFTESSRAAQLATNLDALELVADLPDDHDGMTWAYTAHNGSTYTANGWVEAWDVAREGLTVARVGFELVIPAGIWTPT